VGRDATGRRRPGRRRRWIVGDDIVFFKVESLNLIVFQFIILLSVCLRGGDGLQFKLANAIDDVVYVLLPIAGAMTGYHSPVFQPHAGALY
jgi:hypothetical protein